MPHHHSKVKLSPIQNAINWILEDGGSEYLTCVINTLHPEFSNLPAPDIIFLESAEKAIRGSLKLGLLKICRYFNHDWIPITGFEIEQILTFQEVFEWNEQGKIWHWNEKHGGSNTIELVLTEKGYQALNICPAKLKRTR